MSEDTAEYKCPEVVSDGERYEGDFALLNPLPYLTDEDGTYHCPMPIVRRRLLADDSERRERALCGEELTVTYTLVCPVPDLGDTIQPREASSWANYSRWELRCTSGHVLATSDGDEYDYDLEFDPRHWFSRWPHNDHGQPAETGSSTGSSEVPDV